MRFNKMCDMTKIKTMAAAAVIMLAGAAAYAQSPRILTLDECRDMAIESNRDLVQARTKVQMADYDRKIALANYFPKVSATGAYMYNTRSIQLVSDEQSDRLRNAGTTVQQKVNEGADAYMHNLLAQFGLSSAIAGSPLGQALIDAIKNTEKWRNIDQALHGADIATPINEIGREVDDALHPDSHNLVIGVVSVQQPVFVGGKIVLSNQMAALARELAQGQYDMKYADILTDIDQAYWQIVSVASKKKLAESYSDLLHQMVKDVDVMVQAGVATKSDALQIKVKANEADMMLTKATNGLVLSKMLLCKKVGLPLDTEIVLSDEDIESVPVPVPGAPKDLESIYADRPETRCLDLAGKIYDKKAGVVRADMMPQVALMANYILTNPNIYNGFQKNFGGAFSFGVMVNVPIFHGFEALNKTRKAKAEATLYREQLADAKDLINLQVTQQRKIFEETLAKVNMAESNLEEAEENMKKATTGYEAGVVDTSTMLGSQTAWLKAHSEYIDAGIELQMAYCSIKKAEGEYKTEK